MRSNVKDMTTGSPMKLIVTFALPLMVGNVFQQLYTVVDTMVVGKALGVDALAALGATDWLYWMVLGMIQGVAQGFGILMARELGARQLENLRRVLAMELMCACQAIDLQGGADKLGAGTKAAYEAVRRVCDKLEEDRPLYEDINRCESLLRDGILLFAVREACGRE